MRAQGFAIASTAFLAALAAALALPARSLAGPRGLHLAVSGMALTNDSSQGGAGPSGTSILTHGDFLYNWGSFGIGGFFQYDRQGSSETDGAGGPKIELNPGPFYLEAGYAV